MDDQDSTIRLICGKYRLIDVKHIGSFGVVCQAENQETNKRVALKAFLNRDRGIEELEAIRQLGSDPDRCPGLVRVYDACHTAANDILKAMEGVSNAERIEEIVRKLRPRDGPLPACVSVLVMEWVEGVRLKKWWAETHKPDRPNALHRVAGEILDTLRYLYESGYRHGDVKPDNIMISHRTGTALLVDYSLTALLDDYVRSIPGEGLDPAYRAPSEVSIGNRKVKNTIEADLYSLGLVLYELALGKKLPYSKRGKKVKLNMGRLLKAGYHERFVDLIERLLYPEPSDRLPTLAWQTPAPSERIPIEVGPAASRRTTGMLIAGCLAAAAFALLGCWLEWGVTPISTPSFSSPPVVESEDGDGIPLESFSEESRRRRLDH